MAVDYFLMFCLLAAMATVTVQHSTGTTNSLLNLTLKKILKTLVKIESTLDLSHKNSSAVGRDAVVDQLAADLLITKSQLKTIQTELGAVKDLKTGSTFVRWGRKSCPTHTTLVYSGFAGGKGFRSPGSGSNRLCLTASPQFDKVGAPSMYGTLYGAEYDGIPGHHNHDVPCSVCRAAQSTTIMIAGTMTCPAGWTSQYAGHLASAREAAGHSESDYVCLDSNLEDIMGSIGDKYGNLFLYVKAVCGALPCLPYVNGKVTTCTVCSK